MIGGEVYSRVGQRRLGVLSIPVQTREVGKLKKILVPFVLVVLFTFVVLSATACSVTTSVVNATVYGAGTEDMPAAAKLVDEAIEGIDKSANIEVPSTVTAGKLTVGSDSAYPPLEFLAKVTTKQDGENKTAVELVGMEVDLCKAVAKKLGLEASFVAINWSETDSALAERKVDIIASAMITSAERKAELGASDVYLAADLAICAPSAAGLVDASSLADKVVGVQTGSIAEKVLGSIDGLRETRVYPHVLGALADLQAGKLDAVVLEEPACLWILANDPQYSDSLEITGKIQTGEGYALWANTDDAKLLEAVNAALQELRQGDITTGATTTSSPSLTTTTAVSGGTTAGSTNTTQAVAAKSVFQLILEKWGLSEVAG